LGYASFPKFCGSTSIFTQSLKLGTPNLVHSLGLPRPTIKPHPEEKWVWPWVREALIYLGFPFNISATAALFFSVSGASCSKLITRIYDCTRRSHDVCWVIGPFTLDVSVSSILMERHKTRGHFHFVGYA